MFESRNDYYTQNSAWNREFGLIYKYCVVKIDLMFVNKLNKYPKYSFVSIQNYYDVR